ncbi:MAG TPA: hypothetical protein VLE70_14930, partial [Anaerolineae bacterium]|nr:hypothetical protein [Anaerolineae bacterium]
RNTRRFFDHLLVDVFKRTYLAYSPRVSAFIFTLLEICQVKRPGLSLSGRSLIEHFPALA